MQKTTPNWEEVATILVSFLGDIADGVQWKIENGEDSASAVDDAADELIAFLEALEDDPSQFVMKDVS